MRMVITLGALLADVPHTPPGVDHRHRLRRVAASSASATSARATRAPPASSACSTTPAPRPASRRPACGPRCRTTWPPRPTRRWRSRWCARSRARPGWWWTRGELESAAEDYERQVTAAVASDPEVKAFVERLECGDRRDATREPVRAGPPLGRHDRARLPALPAPARAERPEPRPFPRLRTGRGSGEVGVGRTRHFVTLSISSMARGMWRLLHRHGSALGSG